jgi:hypothetical protein
MNNTVGMGALWNCSHGDFEIVKNNFTFLFLLALFE